ncbi:MAG: (d)CMP kinase [Dehalococcoidia bacterium]
MINQINFNTQIITIDGPAASGKSTVGELLSKKINFRYLDTGLMYRAITTYFIQKKILPEQIEKIYNQLEKITFTIKFTQARTVNIFVNNKNVMSELFLPNTDLLVSNFSSISCVRKFLVDKQRLVAKNGNIIMIGRDIGTVVIPDAKFKFYLNATSLIRAKRRYSQSKNSNKSIEEIKNSIDLRDKIDSTRKDSPLKPAKDALIINTGNLSLNEVVDKMYSVFIGENL